MRIRWRSNRCWFLCFRSRFAWGCFRCPISMTAAITLPIRTAVVTTRLTPASRCRNSLRRPTTPVWCCAILPYYPVTREVVLARTLQFGYIQRLGGLADIPLGERFFAGGASSQRAFPDNQAGPRDPITGFPLGGNAFLFHSAKNHAFRYSAKMLGGVLFHDMGNVYSSIDHDQLPLSAKTRIRISTTWCMRSGVWHSVL